MNALTEALLRWYDQNARTLPWRGFHDAYRTWISEAMLQQTRVETVLSYYERFLARFPTLASLAEAPLEEVLRQWEGLGYYSRARNLWNGARQVALEYGGILPRDPDQLRRISGIGPYTAGAIASIAYDVPVPAVDGNVVRVLSRVDGLREDATAPESRRRIDTLAAELVPPERPGDHNQAMMDLGATVCVPGTPDCDRCPLTGFCDAFRRGDAPELPILPRARPQKLLPWTVAVLVSGGRTLIRRRTEKLLEGLWCFPMFEGHLSPEALDGQIRKKLQISCSSLRDAGRARHVFTHQIWEMRLFLCEAPADASAPGGYLFVPVGDLSGYPFPVAMKSARSVLRQHVETGGRP